MDEITGTVLLYFIFFGWILILSLGKAISWIIDSLKNNDENNKDNKDE